MSTPASNNDVANVWRNICGVICSGRSANLVYRLTICRTDCVERARPSRLTSMQPLVSISLSNTHRYLSITFTDSGISTSITRSLLPLPKISSRSCAPVMEKVSGERRQSSDTRIPVLNSSSKTRLFSRQETDGRQYSKYRSPCRAKPRAAAVWNRSTG